MSAAEAADRIRADHEMLREMLSEIETLAERFEEGGEQVAAQLSARGLDLYERFQEHLELEDRLLKPILNAAGPAGERGARHLEHEHREQRELIRYLLDRLTRNPIPTLLIARELRNFVEYVRLDMLYEESTLLSDEMLGTAGSS